MRFYAGLFAREVTAEDRKGGSELGDIPNDEAILPKLRSGIATGCGATAIALGVAWSPSQPMSDGTACRGTANHCRGTMHCTISLDDVSLTMLVASSGTMGLVR